VPPLGRWDFVSLPLSKARFLSPGDLL
jgi:hypothetical protein